MQVGADGDVAVVGELAGDLLRRLVPPGIVMIDDDRWVRSAAQGPGEVGIDDVAIVAFDADGLGEQALVHGASPIKTCDGTLTLGPLRDTAVDESERRHVDEDLVVGRGCPVPRATRSSG